MFPTILFTTAGMLGVGSGVAMLEAGYPSAGFSIGINLLTVAANTALCGFIARRWSDAVNRAFDFGVEVGERRAKQAVHPYILRDDDNH